MYTYLYIENKNLYEDTLGGGGEGENKLTVKAPAAKKVYSSSVKAPHSTSAPAFLGGILRLSPTLASNSPNAWRNPMALTVQGNPTEGNSCLAMAGKISPPVELPHAVMPMARPRFLLKYVDTVATVGQKRQPLPMPMQTPWARNSCQYLVHTDVVKIPSI
jgi:hypothetical protein